MNVTHIKPAQSNNQRTLNTFVKVENDSKIPFDLKMPAGQNSATAKPPRRTRSSFTTTVKIGIAERGKFYTVHKDLICKCSTFFEDAFNGPYRETAKRSIVLRGYAESELLSFVEWLYTGRIGASDTDDELTPFQICHLYVFADDHQIIQLQNDTLTEFVRQINRDESSYYALPTTFDIDLIRYVYQNMDVESDVKKLLIDTFIMGPSDELAAIVRTWHEAPHEFMVDLMDGFRGLANGSRSSLFPFNACDYHDHQDGQRCSASTASSATLEADTA